MPDLRVEPEHRLDGVALEPPVEQLARAAGHEIPEVALGRTGEKGELSAQTQRMQPVAPAPSQVGWRFEDQTAQRIRRGFDRAVAIGQALRVARRKSSQLPFRIA